ncbi:MAG: galactokinase [Limisphaerales bacterium]
MSIKVQKFFAQKFGYPPTSLVQAPGRVELLGNHTDYHQGLVLSLAVDKYIFIASSRRDDKKIRLVSTAFPEGEIFSLSDLKKNPAAPWADYSKGVLDQLQKRQVAIGGFDAGIDSTIPIGAGLSSSAALEVATALTVRQLFPYTTRKKGSAIALKRNAQGALPKLKPEEKLDLAKICQAGENQFVGVRCGLLDQISSLFGRALHAIEIDCRDLFIKHVPMRGEMAVVICHSGVKHSLAGGEYNGLRRQSESAAKKLGVKFLRSVSAKMLSENKSKLTRREYQCAYHIVGENRRVILGAQALRKKDFAQFGQYMWESHESSRDYFHNSTNELDLLVELAREHPATLGARLTGGGFGGATINLIQRRAIQNFSEYISARYEKISGYKMKPLLCEVVDGAK